jgi:hypothetical protein
MIKILFLAANPKDTDPLRLGEEVRAIKERLRLAELRDQFVVEQEHAVRITDLQGYLLQHRPQIVHFSGHGRQVGEIVLEDAEGWSQPVSPGALKRTFAVLRGNVRCVVLNACYSEAQAKGIAESIDCVVGMGRAIGDESAIAFAAGFYQALGYERNVQEAFDLGCGQIDLEGLGDEDVPKLAVAIGVDAKGLYLTTNAAGSAAKGPTAPTPSKVKVERPGSGDQGKPVEVFFSYSHRDEKLRDQLEEHLANLKRQGVISGWHDRKIGAGKEWAGEIDEHLNSAQVVLLLVSSSFVASDYCHDVEIKRALERHEKGEARVIPVILRPADWHGADFGKLQALPRDARPVTSWRSRDEAFKNVAEGLRTAVKSSGDWALVPESPINATTPHLKVRFESIDIFMVGCGFGNRVALLPVTPGTADATPIAEWLDALGRLGLDKNEAVQAFAMNNSTLAAAIRANSENETIRPLIDRYFDLMTKVRDVVRQAVGTSDFRWFQLGASLYEVATWSIIAPAADERGIQVAILSASLEQLILPIPVKDRLGKFIRAASSKRKKDLLTPANEVARLLYAML